jgi:hypothetical protein
MTRARGAERLYCPVCFGGDRTHWLLRVPARMALGSGTLSWLAGTFVDECRPGGLALGAALFVAAAIFGRERACSRCDYRGAFRARRQSPGRAHHRAARSGSLGRRRGAGFQ